MLLPLVLWIYVSASSSVCGQCVPKVISFVDQDILPLSIGGTLSLQCVPQSDSDILIECCRSICADTCCGIVSTNQLLSCTQACVLRHRGLREDLCVQACDIHECDRHIGDTTYDTCGQCECPLEDASSCRRGCSVDVPCEDIEIRVVAYTLNTLWNISSTAGVELRDGPFGEEDVNRTHTISACVSPGAYTFHASGNGSLSIEGVMQNAVFDESSIHGSFSVAPSLSFLGVSLTLQADDDDDDLADVDFNMTQDNLTATLRHGTHAGGYANRTSANVSPEFTWLNSTDATRRDRVVDLFIASCINDACDNANSALWNAPRVVHWGVDAGDALSTLVIPRTSSGSHFLVFDAFDETSESAARPVGRPLTIFPIHDAHAIVRAVTFVDEHLEENTLVGTLNWALEGDHVHSLDVSFDVSVSKCIPAQQSVADCGPFCTHALPAPDHDTYVMLPAQNVTEGCINAEVLSAAPAGESAETLTAVVDCGGALDDTSWDLNFSVPLPPLVWTIDTTVFGKLNRGELASLYESDNGARVRRKRALSSRYTGPQRGAPQSSPTSTVAHHSATSTSGGRAGKKLERRIVKQGHVRAGAQKSRVLVSDGAEDDDFEETNEFTLVLEDMVTSGRAFIERELTPDGNATSGNFGTTSDIDADNHTITGYTGDATPSDLAGDSDVADWTCTSHCGQVGPACSCHLDCASLQTCCADYEDTCLSTSTTWHTHAPCRAQGPCVVFPSLLDGIDHVAYSCAIHARASGMLSYSTAVFDLTVTTPDRGIHLELTDDARWNRVPLTPSSKLRWSVKNSVDKEICLVGTIASLWAYTESCTVEGPCVSVRDDAVQACSAISFQPGALTYSGPTFLNGHSIAGLLPPHI